MTSLIRINNAIFKPKMIGLDYDWTLVNPKSDETIPKDMDDWEWYTDNIKETLTKYNKNNFMLVIFTNQSKKWKHEQIKKSLESLNLPFFICIATSKEHYKPANNLFLEFIENIDFNPEKISIDKIRSLYIGDAAGRNSDFSDSDKLFAESIGIDFKTPELFFNIKPYKLTDHTFNTILKSINGVKMIIMVGYPGSGKSSLARMISKTRNNTTKKYKILSGDDLKTITKFKKPIKEALENNMIPIIDATNGKQSKRENYIKYASEFIEREDVAIIHVNLGLKESFKNNKLRDKQIPKIAYYTYRKHFEDIEPFEAGKIIKIY